MANKLELAEMIKSLRQELIEAQRAGKDEKLRFTVEDVELDLDVVMEAEGEGGVAAKFYVLTSHFKAKRKDVVTQKIRLKLKPGEVKAKKGDGEAEEGKTEEEERLLPLEISKRSKGKR